MRILVDGLRVVIDLRMAGDGSSEKEGERRGRTNLIFSLSSAADEIFAQDIDEAPIHRRSDVVELGDESMF